MALNAREVKTASKPIPAMDPGTMPGRLVQVIDLGVQPQEYQKQEKAPKTEIMTTYEFSDEFLLDDKGEPDEKKPRWLSETFALNSLESEKARSTMRYYALDPNEEYLGDWTALIGTPAMITVVQNKKGDKVYNNIAGVSTMRAKDAARLPELVNPPKVFSMSDPDPTIFKSLPEWVQDKIKGSLEYEGSKLHTLLGEEPVKEKPKKAEQKKAIVDNIPHEFAGEAVRNGLVAVVEDDGGDW